MRDENCIFCKIIAGEIPSNTIYEDDEFKVVLDVSPASKGHALILPKNHYADLYEIDENVAADAMKLAKKLAIHMTDVLKCDGFNLVQNNHEVAGQTVFHFHMHLIPRYLNAKNNDILNWNHKLNPKSCCMIRKSTFHATALSNLLAIDHSSSFWRRHRSERQWQRSNSYHYFFPWLPHNVLCVRKHGQ